MKKPIRIPNNKNLYVLINQLNIGDSLIGKRYRIDYVPDGAKGLYTLYDNARVVKTARNSNTFKNHLPLITEPMVIHRHACMEINDDIELLGFYPAYDPVITPTNAIGKIMDIAVSGVNKCQDILIMLIQEHQFFSYR